MGLCIDLFLPQRRKGAKFLRFDFFWIVDYDQLNSLQIENFLIHLFNEFLVKKTVLFYTEKYPISKTQLLIWYNEFSKHHFQNFNELKIVIIVKALAKIASILAKANCV